MRILVIADAIIPVPPVGYGGTERVLGALCDGFAQNGHEVVLMASAGSRVSGHLVQHRASDDSSWPSRAFRKIWFQPLSLHAARGCDVVLAAGRVDYLHAILASRLPVAVMFQNPVQQSAVAFLRSRRTYAALRLIALSSAQRSEFRDDLWSVIPNGVDTACFRPADPSGEDLAFLGRLVPQKGIATAIRVARRSGRRLRIGGIAPDQAYFDSVIRPQLDRDIEYLGELDSVGSAALLSASAALLFPITWPEPFGLVMAESLACGTPVVALRAGSVPEVVRDGMTGFICDDEDEMVDRVGRISEISRAACRSDATARFSWDRMTTAYLRLLEELVGRDSHA